MILGPWLQRLSLAMGPLRAERHLGSGNPDGVGGLSRRGTYERLLVSEWLFADELPDEFARRAAMQEHLFLELSAASPRAPAARWRSPTPAPRSWARPAWATSPRSSCWPVAPRRRGPPHWGILRPPGTGTTRNVSHSTVLALLQARCAGRCAPRSWPLRTTRRRAPSSNELHAFSLSSLPQLQIDRTIPRHDREHVLVTHAMPRTTEMVHRWRATFRLLGLVKDGSIARLQCDPTTALDLALDPPCCPP